MLVPKNNLNLPDPSVVAYRALDRFETITSMQPPFRQDGVPEYLKDNTFLVDGTLIGLETAHSTWSARDHELLTEMDGSTKQSMWLPSGLVKYGGGSFAIPDIDKTAYVLGRRVSKGDPREAVVLPAIFHVNRGPGVLDRNPHGLYVEDITSKANKLSELTGWLDWVVEVSKKPAAHHA